MSELFNLDDIVAITPPRKLDTKMTWLVYAPPGTGKTMFGGSASEVEAMSPVLMIDLEDGSSTLSHKYPDVKVAKVNDWETCAALIEALVGNETGYKTVIIDSISKMQEMILEWSIRVNGDSNGFEKWAHAYEKASMVIESLHRSDYHLICTTPAERTTDEFSRNRMIMPYFEGQKSKTKMPGKFDMIAYMFTQEDSEGVKRRVLQLEQDDETVTKNRAGDYLPGFMPDPDFKKIYEALTAE